MARKLMAILLVVCMAIPMMVFQANAATPSGTATYSVGDNFDEDNGGAMAGYNVFGSDRLYPLASYHFMQRIYLNWVEDDPANLSDQDHMIISWTQNGGFGYGFDLQTNKAYIGNVGWTVTDATVMAATGDCTLVPGTYYQFDWFVSNEFIKGYVNGDLVVEYRNNGSQSLFTPGGYLIGWPKKCGYDALWTTVEEHNGIICNGDGSSKFIDGASDGWTVDAPLQAGEITVDTYTVNDADWAIEAIGANVYYQEATNRQSDFSAEGFRLYTTGDQGYSNQFVNGGATIGFDFIMEFDFKGLGGTGDFCGGQDSWNVGYDNAAKKFVLQSGGPFGGVNPDADGALTYAMELNPDLVYHWKLQAETTGIKFWIDDTLIFDTSNFVRKDGWYIFYPKNCYAEITNYDWFLNLAGAWTRWSDINTPTTLTGPATGAALISEDPATGAYSWHDRGTGYGAYVINVTAPAVLDSGAAIAAAEAAVAATPDASTVLLADVLNGKKAEYQALRLGDPEVSAVVSAIANIGVVTLDSLSTLNTVQGMYDALSPEKQALVQTANYQTLVDDWATYYDLVDAATAAPVTAAIEKAVAQTIRYNPDPVETGVTCNVLGEGMAAYNQINQLANDPYSVEFDIVPVYNDENAGSWVGFGWNFNCGVGYSFYYHKFFITQDVRLFNGDARVLSIASDEIVLENNTLYNIKFDVGHDEVAIYLDGVKVVSSTSITLSDSTWAISYPKYACYRMSNLTIINNGSTIADHLTGDALASNTVWPMSGNYNTTGVVPMIQDSGAELAACRAAYNALTDAQKAKVTNIAALEAAEAEYAALQVPAFIYGDVDDSGDIDLGDAVLLLQYIANYDDTTGTSTIVLGPQA